MLQMRKIFIDKLVLPIFHFARESYNWPENGTNSTENGSNSTENGTIHQRIGEVIPACDIRNHYARYILWTCITNQPCLLFAKPTGLKVTYRWVHILNYMFNMTWIEYLKIVCKCLLKVPVAQCLLDMTSRTYLLKCHLTTDLQIRFQLVRVTLAPCFSFYIKLQYINHSSR